MKFPKLRVRREMHTGANTTAKTAKKFSRRTRSGATETPKKSRLVMLDIGNAAPLRLPKARCQTLIAEVLNVGEDCALDASTLCSFLGLQKRQLTKAIAAERRAGAFICASTDPARPGYYIAESVDEFRRYLRSLENRERELRLTRESLIDAARRKGIDL